jgi:type II secretory pathway component PulC
MRDRGLLVSGLVLVLLVPACGKQGEAPAEKQAKEKAVTSPTEAPPTATPTEEPTATPVPTPSPLPTSPPEPQEGAAEDLQLLGIIRGGTTSGALIAFNGKQEIFRKGDSVFDHGTIKEVREDSVVIRSGGKDATLKIVTETAPPRAEAQPAPAEQVVESTPPVREAAPPPATGPLSRADVRTGLRDLADVLAKADAKRVSVGGGHGLQFGKVDPSSFLAKLGLRNGDVLQKINGTPIDDLDKVPDLSASADGNELTLTFSRNDISLTVTRRLQ